MELKTAAHPLFPLTRHPEVAAEIMEASAQSTEVEVILVFLSSKQSFIQFQVSKFNEHLFYW